MSSRRIAAIPASLVSGVREEKEQKDYLGVAGMSAAIENFLTRGQWPGANGWERETGEVVTPGDLGRLHDIVRGMAR